MAARLYVRIAATSRWLLLLCFVTGETTGDGHTDFVLGQLPGGALSERCDIAIMNASRSGVYDEFFGQFQGMKPVIIRHFLRDTDSRLGRDELLLYGRDIPVSVGSPAEIIAAHGEGPDRSWTLGSFLQNLHTVEGSYLFDRGGIFEHASQEFRKKILEPFPVLLTPNKNTVQGAGGFMLDPIQTISGIMNLPEDIGPRAGQDVYVIIGANGSGVPYHNHADSLLLLHSGYKLWFVQGPQANPEPRFYHPGGMREYQPKPSDKLCMQHPGDLIYIPEGWHHATLNFGETFATALQSRIPTDSNRRARQSANSLRMARMYGESVQAHDDLIKRFPGDRKGLESKAQLLYEMEKSEDDPDKRKGLLKEALVILVDIYESTPNSFDPVLLLCKVLVNMGVNNEYSEAVCKKTTHLNPYSFDAAFYFGRTLAELKKFTSAAQQFRRATKLNARSYQSYYHLANSLMQADREQFANDGIAAYRKVIELQPNLAQARFELGVALMHIDSKEATVHLLAAANLNGELTDMVNMMVSQLNIHADPRNREEF